LLATFFVEADEISSLFLPFLFRGGILASTQFRNDFRDFEVIGTQHHHVGCALKYRISELAELDVFCLSDALTGGVPGISDSANIWATVRQPPSRVNLGSPWPRLVGTTGWQFSRFRRPTSVSPMPPQVWHSPLPSHTERDDSYPSGLKAPEISSLWIFLSHGKLYR
jgi:hypothetical protein